MAQSDVREINEQDGKTAPKRRFDARDWDYIAQNVIEEYEARKGRRREREKCWDDIDRQVEMRPNTEFKYIVKNGSRVLDHRKAWMSEVELPLQAQALEVLTADARRMEFPDSGAWFRAHGAMTDDYLRKVDFQSIIMGDETEVPSRINQDNVDKLVEGFLTQMFRERVRDEDFLTRMDRINAESFKYGVGVGRARVENKTLFMNTPRGVRKEARKFPVLMPCSIRNLFLDDVSQSMHTTQLLEPAHIARDYIRLQNLLMAANLGSNDPDDEDGGWMPQNMKRLVADDNGYVTLLEMEGDIVVPRKTVRSMVIPGAIVTVAIGGKDAGGAVTNAVIRFRFRKYPWSSYVLFPYHYESAGDAYPTSPLMKGRPVQMAASDALNRFLDSAMLKNTPPVGYDRTDPVFAQNGGPEIYPGSMWATADPAAIKAHTELGGEPSSLAAAMAQFINLYAELTGVLPARLGAQTNSHTTAFAKDAELQRGAVRTVDFVRQCGQGPLTRWLDMAYRMGRDVIGRDPISFFIDAYGGFVEITKEHLPERATFEWFGSGGPAEEMQKKQLRMQALATAVQMDQLGAAIGKRPRVDLDAAIDQTLREGGWTDIDAITNQGGGGVPALGPGPVVAALPNLIAQANEAA